MQKPNTLLSNSDVVFIKTELESLVKDILSNNTKGLKDKALMIKVELDRRFNDVDYETLENSILYCCSITSNDLYSRSRKKDFIIPRTVFITMSYKLELTTVELLEKKFNLKEQAVRNKINNHSFRLTYDHEYRDIFNKVCKFLNIEHGIFEAEEA